MVTFFFLCFNIIKFHFKIGVAFGSIMMKYINIEITHKEQKKLIYLPLFEEVTNVKIIYFS